MCCRKLLLLLPSSAASIPSVNVDEGLRTLSGRCSILNLLLLLESLRALRATTNAQITGARMLALDPIVLVMLFVC